MGDFAAKIERARRSEMPLRRLMEQHGKGPKNGNWKRFPCPYCDNPDSAGVFDKSGFAFFKCHYTSCPTGNKAMDEIGFLARELNCSRRDASVAYLKEAGLWTEERLAPSIMPGQRARKKPAPKLEVPDAPESVPPTEPEAGDSFEAADPDRASSRRLLQVHELDVMFAGFFVRQPIAIGWPHAGGPTSGPQEPQEPVAEAQWKPIGLGLSIGSMFIGGGTKPPGEPPADPPDPPDPPLPPEDETPAPLRALRLFYSWLTLTAEDRLMMWQKRGILSSTCDIFGLRSSPLSNRDLLMNLVPLFSMIVLLEAGLFVQNQGEEPQPNNRYYGYGRLRKKPREDREYEEDKWIYGWTHPTLIPYFDSQGELVALRPHKDHIKGAIMRVFVAKAPGAEPDPNCNSVIITEGEFKAIALWQASQPAGPVAPDGRHEGPRPPLILALPGITMAKQLQGDIEEELEKIAPLATARVAYDSEEKADPALPGYIEYPWKRFDAVIWARYLARQLAKEGYEARVAVLPKAWRDSNGKADWDGAMAKLVADFNVRAGLATEGTPEEIWRRVRGRVWTAFRKELDQAPKVGVAYQAGLFDSEEERIIRNGLEKLCYDPKLPVGGDAEQVAAARIKRFVARVRLEPDRLDAKSRSYLSMLADNYTKMKGGYYIMKALDEKKAENWQRIKDKAAAKDDLELKRMCELVLYGIGARGGGMPKSVSNFYMDAHYMLKRSDGHLVRQVTMVSVHGEIKRNRELAHGDFGQPSKWRDWVIDQGNFAWDGGQTELSFLHHDCGRQLLWKEAEEITLRGYHEPSNLWFYEDGAYGPNGTFYPPDKKHGIIWAKVKTAKGEEQRGVQGYKLASKDHEGQPFRQGSPDLSRNGHEPIKDMGAFLREVCQKLYETVGTYEGYIGFGLMCACAAGPEIYKDWVGMPCMWVYGEHQQGKSTYVRWLMRIWGFTKESGITLSGTSEPGLANEAAKYSFEPLWLEEYQPEKTSAALLEGLKQLFGKETNSKIRVSGQERARRAMGIVTGVGTCMEPQIKSRFAHIHIASSKRIANHYDWFQREHLRFPEIGRMLMLRRGEYAAALRKYLRLWMESPDLENVETRAKLVHGVAYAGLLAIIELIQGEWDAADLANYRKFLTKYCREQLAESRSAVPANAFLQNVISLATASTRSEMQRYIAWHEEAVDAPELAPQQNQRSWTRAIMYCKMGPLLDELRKFNRLRGIDITYNLGDLRKEMKNKPYWLPDGRSCFSDPKYRERCWGIVVELTELGYVPVSDAEFEQSLYKDGVPANGVMIATPDWQDPRYGDLYALGELIRKK